MKYAKLLGLFAVAATSLMALAGNASATTGTDSAGGSPVEAGDSIHAVAVTHAEFHLSTTITCKKSTISGVVTNAGDTVTTLSGDITQWTFEECAPNTVTVIKTGTFEVHTDHNSPNVSDRNGTWTSSGAEITLLTHNLLGTVHCIVVTKNTNLFTIDGSANRSNQTATLTSTSEGAASQVSTDFGCGSSSELTAHYSVTTPDYLDIH
jgi:hypothetical protein